MNRHFIVIVTGPPGAGKTVLGKRLAAEMELPFFGKDDIKELLFETLGWEDRQWSMKLGQASYEVLFHCLECQLEARKAVIVETAFIPQYHDARFLGLRDKYGFESVQIVCNASDEVLFERFIKRVESGERHPGHVDDQMSFSEFTELLREQRYGALGIGGLLIEVDTTDFEAVDFEGLVEAIVSLGKNHA